MRKIFLIIICLFFNFCFAENFFIKNYDVNIKVNEDNTANIEEIIEVSFDKSFTPVSHGIYRRIPLKKL